MNWRARVGSISVVLLFLSACLAGCGGSGGYVDPNVDFSYMQRAAVLPFENISSDRLADERMYSVFLMELLNEEILDIVDPGETVSAMRKLGISAGSALTPEQAVELGDTLRVDALFFGIVEEYGLSQADRKRGYEVTAVFGMTETETGTVVWRSQVNEKGTSTWNKVFGGSSKGLYEISRKAVQKALGSLL